MLVIVSEGKSKARLFQNSVQPYFFIYFFCLYHIMEQPICFFAVESLKNIIMKLQKKDDEIRDAYIDEVTNYEDDSQEQNALFYNIVLSVKIEEYLKKNKTS